MTFNMPLGYSLAIAEDDLLIGIKLLTRQQAIAFWLSTRLRKPDRIDGIRTVTRQQAEVMHFARLTGFQHNTDARPFGFAHQVMVHSRRGQQRADRHAIGADRAIRENYQLVTRIDGRFSFGADAINGLKQSWFAQLAIVRNVDGATGPRAMMFFFQVSQRRELFVGQKLGGASVGDGNVRATHRAGFARGRCNIPTT